MKKQYIFIGLLLAAIITIVTLSVNKYNAQPKGITLEQAVSQRNTALTDLKIQKSLNDNDQTAIKNLTAERQNLLDTNTTLCNKLKAAKLVQPLCNK